MSCYSHEERKLIVYDKQEYEMYDGEDFIEYDEDLLNMRQSTSTNQRSLSCTDNSI